MLSNITTVNLIFMGRPTLVGVTGVQHIWEIYISISYKTFDCYCGIEVLVG